MAELANRYGSQIVSLDRFDQRVDRSTCVNAGNRVTKNPIFSANYGWTDLVLNQIVGDRYCAIVAVTSGHVGQRTLPFVDVTG